MQTEDGNHLATWPLYKKKTPSNLNLYQQIITFNNSIFSTPKKQNNE